MKEVGSSGGATKKTYTTSDQTVEKITPQTLTVLEGGNIRNGVFDVTAVGNGEIKVVGADAIKNEKNSSNKYTEYEYHTKGAYINLGGDSGEYSDNRDATESVGVNWDNVTAISGATYPLRTFAKNNGFKWDGKTKKWVK